MSAYRQQRLQGRTDGVDATARAGVAARGATEGRGSLGRGVRDGVTRGSAATLEGVEETEPVSSFVSESLTVFFCQ